ncbi:MAG: peptide ABC transporter substrate-binding protein [Planctomycetota bacterium]
MALSRTLRQAVPVLLLGGLLAAAIWTTRGARLEPADFVFNNGTELQTLDPATVTGQPEGRALRMLLEGLTVSHPRTLEALPGMAESWEVSDDQLVYTFKIRDDAHWTNGDGTRGDRFTAEDFVYSFRRLLDPRTAAQYAYMLWYVKGAKAFTTTVADDGGPALSFDTVGITALDPTTLRIELESPTPFFLSITSFYALFPVSRAGIERAQRLFPDTWEYEWLRPENYCTNGPYRVSFRRVNDRIRFEKNPLYWDADAVAMETVDMLALEQYTTGLNMYLTGECHWIDVPPANVIQRLMPREDFNPRPYLGSYFYRVNCTKPPLDDRRVRRALALSLPRVPIVETITKAGQVPAYGLVPPGIDGYGGARMRRNATFEEDLAEAKELIVEAGYGPGGKELPPIEIHYNTSEAHRDIAEVISDAWAANLGIRTKLRNQEWKVYLDTQARLGYDVSRSAWIGDYADPNTFIDIFLTGGENNKTGWSNADYDRLVAEANRTADPARRFELLSEAEAILMEELPVLPLYYYVTQSTYSPRLGGYHPNVKDEHYPKFWYWMNDEELAEKRAGYPDEGFELVDATGPPKGLYPPRDPRSRTDSSDTNDGPPNGSATTGSDD